MELRLISLEIKRLMACNSASLSNELSDILKISPILILDNGIIRTKKKSLDALTGGYFVGGLEKKSG